MTCSVAYRRSTVFFPAQDGGAVGWDRHHPRSPFKHRSCEQVSQRGRDRRAFRALATPFYAVHEYPIDVRECRASVPFPTFVSSRSTRFYERRKQRDTSKS